MAKQSGTLVVPDSLESKMGPVLFLLVILFLVYLNNAGKLQKLLAVFAGSGASGGSDTPGVSAGVGTIGGVNVGGNVGGAGRASGNGAFWGRIGNRGHGTRKGSY